ncbi:adenine phosphoribosyltransferase [Nakamurella antarctica]|uniref:Adenine phosphoribosyltransferase n=1 Tax=Nakamurella antarctica TaxID=1902245 RepID=A0A3G8ZK81_9ACTN|nr:adenine phosphoribosyltransferase [Nakamurella antarctica]AZI57732.1 adenine phosphoribosyltransferase [Nakamurella antarctica]
MTHSSPAPTRAELLGSAVTALEQLTRVVSDFPSAGVVFRDITPVLADPGGLMAVTQALSVAVTQPFDLVAGLDARGFLLGAAVAVHTGCGVLAIRKAGKLAGAVIGKDYSLEYGTGRLELHPDDVPAGARVLVVDDVLATGGTAAAACSLLIQAGARIAGVAVVMELVDLGGRARVEAATDAPVVAICAL